MISKMVTDRKKTATDLGAALNVHTKDASEALRQMLAPYLEDGDTVPELSKLQRLLGRRLADIKAQLVNADELLRVEQRGDKALRQARDEASRELVSWISRLRSIVDKACGENVCNSQWGIEGTLPRDPVVVQSVATRVLKELNASSLAPPAVPLQGVQVDLGFWAEKIERPLARLDVALEQLAEDNRETLESQLAKSRVLAEYDRSYQATARILEELFRYVGMTDLADRVRTSRRSQASVSAETDPLPATAEAKPPDETIVESRASPVATRKEGDSEEPTN